MKGNTRSKVGGRKNGPAYRTPSRMLGKGRFGQKSGFKRSEGERSQSGFGRDRDGFKRTNDERGQGSFRKDQGSGRRISNERRDFNTARTSFDAKKKFYKPRIRTAPRQAAATEGVEEKPLYPMRLNRYLAIKNYSSRREADSLIEKGLVTVNGVVAKVGDKVKETDVVEVNGKMKQAWKKYRYFLYNKPAKIVTHTSQLGQKSIKDVAGLPGDVFPVGRLDRMSQGLILMTNDGRVTDKLLNPEYSHEKEYVVRVNKNINNFFLRWMSEGIQLEDFKTKPCIVTKVDDDVFKIILTEGKKHQIRRMCTALGYEVRDLRRIRIMDLRIGLLKPGQYKELRGKQLTEFLISLGIG